LNDTQVTDSGPHTAQTRRARVHAAESKGDHPRTVTSPTRISGTWAGIIVGALVLVLLLVFVLQNVQIRRRLGGGRTSDVEPATVADGGTAGAAVTAVRAETE